MVSTPTIVSTLLLAAAAASATASPMTTAPLTPLAAVAPLNHHHPAYAANMAADLLLRPVVPAAGSPDVNIRRLEHALGASVERNYHKLAQLYANASLDDAVWAPPATGVEHDGINCDGAVAKYARAFGLDEHELTTAVSRHSGLLAHPTGLTCQSMDDCSAQSSDAYFCGKRAGETTGRCVQGWFSSGHAASAAAILEQAPRCNVTHGDVTFTPLDIKQLLAQVYDEAGIDTTMLGARYYGAEYGSGQTDQYGRFKDPARLDVNPGLFHLLLTNALGMHKRVFVMDVDNSGRVHNTPVYGYEVRDLIEMTSEEAAQFASHVQTTDYGVFNADAKQWMKVRVTVSYLLEENVKTVNDFGGSRSSSDYEYLLELDQDGNIIGGEWLSEEPEEHPDFVWFPLAQPAKDAKTSSGLSYADVQRLLVASTTCSQ